jgi:hypothetical protein
MATKSTTPKKKQVRYAAEKNLYPINYNGKKYTEKTAHCAFVCNYHSKYSLRGDCAVYCFNGMWVTPDGEIIE